jgi:hypothetical protein
VPLLAAFSAARAPPAPCKLPCRLPPALPCTLPSSLLLPAALNADFELVRYRLPP